RLLGDSSALVRGAAVWALGRLVPAERLAALAIDHRAHESEPLVADEWTAALATTAAGWRRSFFFGPPPPPRITSAHSRTPSDRVCATPRTAQRAGWLERARLGGRPAEMLVFDGTSPSRELASAISQADALLISAAPAEGRDPVLAVFEDEIARAPRLGAV